MKKTICVGDNYRDVYYRCNYQVIGIIGDDIMCIASPWYEEEYFVKKTADELARMKEA